MAMIMFEGGIVSQSFDHSEASYANTYFSNIHDTTTNTGTSFIASTTETNKMGGLNLEVFKFGMYVMFPIGIMYYFGTNLDDRFSVPNFWPKPEECNRIPHDREEIRAEYDRIVARQKLRQAKKLEEEKLR
ncbi:uncharacterized protein F5Z01DRAFT_57874 [Emericellopsis atlantica]|uniref:Uncharacterized protein n=1 Tax=Emericellopsis atlantica TaxID=2614577 RepID=A0A9P7ZND8_9HYPO|nr:uncharacterized protein F5Z01DRAFT_57874 [Emericellopsis atlantica]KAG9254887.1 hypothetical protein F5Z01DRAFT_57874 [Emericellopsis atlantica]